jgi:hypothetical protein
VPDEAESGISPPERVPTVPTKERAENDEETPRKREYRSRKCTSSSPMPSPMKRNTKRGALIATLPQKIRIKMRIPTITL